MPFCLSSLEAVSKSLRGLFWVGLGSNGEALSSLGGLGAPILASAGDPEVSEPLSEGARLGGPSGEDAVFGVSRAVVRGELDEGTDRGPEGVVQEVVRADEKTLLPSMREAGITLGLSTVMMTSLLRGQPFWPFTSGLLLALGTMEPLLDAMGPLAVGLAPLELGPLAVGPLDVSWSLRVLNAPLFIANCSLLFCRRDFEIIILFSPGFNLLPFVWPAAFMAISELR